MRQGGAAIYQRLFDLQLGFDRIFIERPELRPYFYDNRPLPRRRKLRNTVLSVAELMLDVADVVGNQRKHGQLLEADYEWWAFAFRAYFASSPAIRVLWREWQHLYPPETHDLFAADATTRPLSLAGAHLAE